MRQLCGAERSFNPKPETRNPRPETRSPKPETRNPRPETRDPNPESRNPKPATRNPKPETQNPKPESRNLKLETRIPKPETRNPRPETRIPKPGTLNTQHYTLHQVLTRIRSVAVSDATTLLQTVSAPSSTVVGVGEAGGKRVVQARGLRQRERGDQAETVVVGGRGACEVGDSPESSIQIFIALL